MNTPENYKGCISRGCIKRLRYNYLGENKGIFCSEHRTEDMIDYTKKNCLFEGCYTFPSFNFPGKSTGKYCKIHKEEDMINVYYKRNKIELPKYKEEDLIFDIPENPCSECGFFEAEEGKICMLCHILS